MTNILQHNRWSDFVFVVLMVCFATPSYAGLQEQMDTVFNGMVNVTPAGAYDTQRRGVLAGGSIEGRVPVMRPNIIAFSPPSFDGGCGGISMFGGSFSFINAEQFTELLRTIAQNGLSYAFSLAINAMCPSCEEQMAKLQARIQELNGKLSSSCEAGKFLVDKLDVGGKSKALWETAKTDSIASGIIGGASDMLGDLNGFLTPTQQVAQEGTPEQKLRQSYNVVWEQLRKHNVASWYMSGGDDQLMEVLMSLTGSLITYYDAAGADVSTLWLEPTIDFQDFYNGEVDDRLVRRIPVWLCDDLSAAPSKCLNPTRSDTLATPQYVEIEGMLPKVRKMLLGDTATGEIGIIAKWQSNVGSLTDQERAFIEASPAPLLSMIRNTSREPMLARMIAEESVDVIALAMADSLISELMDSISLAVRTNNSDVSVYLPDILEALNKRGAELSEQRKLLAQKESATRETLDMYNSVKASLNIRQYPYGIENSQRVNDGVR